MKKSILTICLLLFFTYLFGQIQKVSILSDGAELNAFFYKAPGNGLKPTIIWMHGLPSKKETGSLELAIELNKENINVIAFDYRGLWNNLGTFTVANSLSDLNSVIDFVRNSEITSKYAIDTNRIIVAGYSFGSDLAAISGVNNNKITEIMCLALTDLSYVAREIFNQDDAKARALLQSFRDGLWGPGKLIQNFDDFMLDLMFNNYKYDFVTRADKLMDKRILLVVGFNDTTAPVENHFFPLYRKLQKLNHKDLKVLITDSNHDFLDLPKSELAKIISFWIRDKK